MNQRVGRVLGRSFSFAAVALVGVFVAACTASTATPVTVPQPLIPSSMAAPDPSASATVPQPTDTAAQSHMPVTLASLVPAPTGLWASIQWTQVITPPVLAQAPATPGGFGPRWSVFGWSRGYVAFDEVLDGPNAAVTEIYTFSSPDGLNWTSGTRLTYGYPVYISGVVEGPAGLLAAAKFVPGTCGGAP